MATYIVNGQRFEVPDGASVSIMNGVVTVNGAQLEAGGPLVRVEINGPVKELRVERGTVAITGDVGKLNAGGSVSVTGNVTGNVDAGGSIQCGHVGGDVDAGGSVQCGNITGDVDAGGSVRRK